MTILAQDTFVRTNQSGWGTASDGNTWSHLGGTSTLNIASNEGTVTGSGTNNAVALSTGTNADQEGVVNVTLSGAADTGGVALRINGAGTTYYVARIGTFSNLIEVGKYVAGSFTSLDLQSFTYTTGVAYSIRFQVIGTALKARIWIAGNAEPGTWNSSITDSSISGAARYGLYANPFSTNGILFDHYSANDTSTITTSTRTVPATAALLLTSSRTVLATTALLATSTRTVSATTALLATSTRIVPVSAALLASTSRSVPASAALIATTSRAVSVSAALLLTSSRSTPTSAALLATDTRTVPASAALIQTRSRAIPSSAALAALRTIPATVALLQTSGRNVPATAALSGIAIIKYNASLIVRSGQASLHVRSGQASLIVRE